MEKVVETPDFNIRLSEAQPSGTDGGRMSHREGLKLLIKEIKNRLSGDDFSVADKYSRPDFVLEDERGNRFIIEVKTDDIDQISKELDESLQALITQIERGE